jgi:predicted metal-dependent hydrolase
MVNQGAKLPELFNRPGSADPAYSVRVSRKAKRVILQVTELGLLQIVLPHGMRRSSIPGVLREHREWIESATNRAKERRPSQPLIDRFAPPSEIRLTALGEIWTVALKGCQNSQPAIQQVRPRALQLIGDLRDPVIWSALLRSWLALRGKQVLIPWLSRVANRTGLRFRSVTVRVQRTRWGSCSVERHISLNARLLMVEPKVAEYVMIHELCHTREMNHSPRFWRLVERHEPDYRRLDRALIVASRQMPWWATGY